MSRPPRPFVACALALVVCCATASADDVYVQSPDFVGSRSTADATVYAQGGWSGTGNNGFEISWAIQDKMAGTLGMWDYSYTISGQGGAPLSKALSHWDLQISETLSLPFEQAFQNLGSDLEGGPKWHQPTPPGDTAKYGNPLMPAPLYGLKWETTGDPLTYATDFQTTQAPVWGDFYAKDGFDVVKNGAKCGPKEKVAVVAWNLGFGETPVDGLADYTRWIPTPDTVTDPPGEVADWGDLPDSFGTLNPDGPRHLDGTHEWLGTLWDDETNGAPSASATGDDMDPLVADDEDGVEFVDGGVYVTPTVDDWEDTDRYNDLDADPDAELWPHHVFIDGWIDLDQDGTFDETDDSDHVVGGYHVNPNTWGADSPPEPIFFPVPNWSPGTGPAGTGYYSRWRLSYGTTTVPTGPVDFGEVEDYQVTPEPASALVLAASLVVLARQRRRRRRNT
ncbi:GEVED domain-containing protein [Planctomycetota bacterium]